MKSVLLTSLAISLVLASALRAQTRPDFSGTWKMDPTRSESALQADPIGAVTEIITQTATEIRIDTTSSRGTSTTTYRVTAANSAADGAPSARWSSDILIVDAIREVRGQSVTTEQRRRLSADGNEMIVESIVQVQHGYTLSGAKNYGSGKDVFVRVRQ